MSARHAGLLAALAAIWGASYLLIKYALEDFDPAFIVFARTALAALVLVAVMGAARRRLAVDAVRGDPRRALVLGFLAITLPFGLITYGELEVPSGLTAVLLAPSSLFVALFARRLDASERITRRRGFGLVLGLVGVALLVGVESVQTLGEFIGALAIIGAAASYALSNFVVKSYAELPTISTSLISTTCGCLLSIPVAAFSLPDHVPGLRAVLAVAALGAAGTALAFLIFYKLIVEAGAGTASLVSYLAPPVSLAYGAALLDEAITPAAVIGLVLILGGMALATRRTPPGGLLRDAPG